MTGSNKSNTALSGIAALTLFLCLVGPTLGSGIQNATNGEVALSYQVLEDVDGAPLIMIEGLAAATPAYCSASEACRQLLRRK